MEAPSPEGLGHLLGRRARVTAEEESRFRLRMARQFRAKAREAAERSDWREAALFARGAIEAAAKAVIACVASVPRSHEPAQILRAALSSPAFPPTLQPEAKALMPRWSRYGMQEHVLLSYGDEQSHQDPWSLVTEERARRTLEAAEEALEFAQRCRDSIIGPMPSGQ